MSVREFVREIMAARRNGDEPDPALVVDPPTGRIVTYDAEAVRPAPPVAPPPPPPPCPCSVCGSLDSVATVRMFGSPVLCRYCRLLFAPMWSDAP